MFFQRYKKRKNAAEKLCRILSLSIKAGYCGTVVNGDEFKGVKVADDISFKVWLIQREKIRSDFGKNPVARFKYLRAD